jgi:hypothetical protein
MPSLKPLPRQVDRRHKHRHDHRADEAARREVRKHWKFRCRICGRKTSVVHEHKRRGAGGEVSLQNSYLACDESDGGLCHPLAQSRHIQPVMVNCADVFDAREDLVFEMTAKVAQLVFERRSLPAHVRIVEGHRAED